MSDPLKRLLAPLPLESRLFPPDSRYHGLETASLIDDKGETVVYLKRRFVPPPERFADLTEHVVSEGERLDHMAHRYLGDSEQFWRIADANRAMRPDELVEEIGRRLRITLPEGVPGAPREDG